MKRKLLTILLATAACGALIGAVGCTGESSSGGGGTEWFTGTASPTEQIEADLGDFYLDEDDFDIYKFTENGWALVGNIKGEDGVDGAAGPAGPAGEDGADGQDGNDGATGPAGPAGEDGEDGKDGADGQTPYIGENGNWWIGDKDTGVKAEGQDGADGASGPAGPAGENGEDGKDGADGQTPYIGENGNWWIGDKDTGVKAEGQDGAAGPAGENGEDGKDGADGQTPYIGDNGNWWIGTTDTGVKAEGQDGADGATGPAGPAGENGEDGKGIADIEISYTIDNEGKECIIFVITYTDQTFDTITVPVPKRVIDFNLQETSFAMCEEGEEPELTIWVNYDDGTGENIVVTGDMFSPEFDTIDFQTAAIYHIGITYQGITQKYDVTVYDPNDTTVTNISVNNSRMIWLVDGEGNLVPNYTGLSLVVNRVNGTNDSIPLETSGADFVLPEDFTVGKDTEVRVSYEGFETGFTVFPVNESEFNSDNYTLNNAFITSYSGDGVWNISCPLNGEPFGDEYYLTMTLYSDSSYGDIPYYMPLTSDMLLNVDGDTPFDNSSEGEHIYYIDSESTFGFKTRDYIGEISINVYDPSNLKIGSISIYGNYDILAGSVSELEFEVQYVSNGNFVYSETISASDVVINGDYSLTEIGEYDIEVEYNGFTTRVNFTVYDPNICNIRNIYLNESIVQEILVGSDIEEYLTENVIGKELLVNYYEPVNDKWDDQIVITRDMIDASGVDVSAPGSGEIVISYALPGQQAKTYTFNITVNIDMSTAKLLASYKLDDQSLVFIVSTLQITNIDCYDNGYGYVTQGEQQVIAAYTIDGNIIKVDMPYMGITVLQINEDTKMLEFYDPQLEITPENTYIYSEGGQMMLFTISGNTVLMNMATGEPIEENLMPVAVFEIDESFDGVHLTVAGGTYELTPGTDGSFGTAVILNG